MGYLIKQGDLITKRITIPEASFLTLDTLPFELLPATLLGAYNIISAIISSKVTSYTNFGHLYLENFSRCAIYDRLAGDLEPLKYNTFAVNMSHPPNIFGTITKSNYPLNISSETTPIGTGDVIIQLIYTIVNF